MNVWLPLVGPELGTWTATQACTLTGNQTKYPLVHRPTLNPLNHTSQGKEFYFIVWIVTEVYYFQMSVKRLTCKDNFCY